MAVTVLVGSGGAIILEPEPANPHDWCQVKLATDGSSLPLGAETVQYLKLHLTSFLTSASPAVTWVLSLSELHCSIYCRLEGINIIIFVHNADAEVIGRLELTPEDQENWARALA